MSCVNVDGVASSFDELWAPRLLAEVNDTSLKIAKIQGEFVWHSHPDSDEMFWVRSGHLTMQLDGEDVELGPGDIYVVPRGARHCPLSPEGAEVVLVERTGTLSTGDFDGSVPDHIISTTGLQA
jgi:mannose-6-phosphate isomerase-like protein (cupin superfamily)